MDFDSYERGLWTGEAVSATLAGGDDGAGLAAAGPI